MIYFILRSGAGGLAIIIKKLGLIDSKALVTRAGAYFRRAA